MKNSKYFLLVGSILLNGCQQLNEKRAEYVRNREYDYLSSAVIAPLQVPADLTHPRANEDFSLVLAPAKVENVSLVPPGFGQLSEGS